MPAYLKKTHAGTGRTPHNRTPVRYSFEPGLSRYLKYFLGQCTSFKVFILRFNHWELICFLGQCQHTKNCNKNILIHHLSLFHCCDMQQVLQGEPHCHFVEPDLCTTKDLVETIEGQTFMTFSPHFKC